jgi:hypothetical protein
MSTTPLTISWNNEGDGKNVLKAMSRMNGKYKEKTMTFKKEQLAIPRGSLRSREQN